MTADYIKQVISEEICEDGGATARLVNTRVLPLGTAVDEVIRGNGHGVVSPTAAFTFRGGRGGFS